MRQGINDTGERRSKNNGQKQLHADPALSAAFSESWNSLYEKNNPIFASESVLQRIVGQSNLLSFCSRA